VWEDISLDFVDGLPSSDSKTMVLVVVDQLTEYSHFLALSHPYIARTLATIFIAQTVCLHGIPKSMVSDWDRVFVSTFWKELFKLQGTQLKMSSTYHP
jgi:hypothetical protein